MAIFTCNFDVYIVVLIIFMQIVDALSVLVLVSRSIVLAWFLKVFRAAGESILDAVS